MLVHKEPQEIRVHKVQRELQVRLDQQGQLEPQELKVLKVEQEP
jgi:hypothetical protein